MPTKLQVPPPVLDAISKGSPHDVAVLHGLVAEFAWSYDDAIDYEFGPLEWWMCETAFDLDGGNTRHPSPAAPEEHLHTMHKQLYDFLTHPEYRRMLSRTFPQQRHRRSGMFRALWQCLPDSIDFTATKAHHSPDVRAAHDCGALDSFSFELGPEDLAFDCTDSDDRWSLAPTPAYACPTKDALTSNSAESTQVDTVRPAGRGADNPDFPDLTVSLSRGHPLMIEYGGDRLLAYSHITLADTLSRLLTRGDKHYGRFTAEQVNSAEAQREIFEVTKHVLPMHGGDVHACSRSLQLPLCGVGGAAGSGHAAPSGGGDAFGSAQSKASVAEAAALGPQFEAPFPCGAWVWESFSRF